MKVMRKKLFSVLMLLALFVAGALFVAPGRASAAADSGAKFVAVREPVNLAIVVQDDVVSRVGNELKVTREFIRNLPAGSRVMVGYARAGSLQVRQKFTTDLDAAANSLRIPVGSSVAAPYSPYVSVREALRHFGADGGNRNALLFISDGLDLSRGFDFSSSANSIDLQRAISSAKERNVSVYSFYAPTAGLTSRNRTAVSYGQSALNRLSDETGGRAFFQGTSFVSFDPYFKRLTRELNEGRESAE